MDCVLVQLKTHGECDTLHPSVKLHFALRFERQYLLRGHDLPRARLTQNKAVSKSSENNQRQASSARRFLVYAGGDGKSRTKVSRGSARLAREHNTSNCSFSALCVKPMNSATLYDPLMLRSSGLLQYVSVLPVSSNHRVLYAPSCRMPRSIRQCVYR